MPSTATNTPANQPKPKGLRDWIEVFRVGTHVDAQGRTLTFTASDLDQMVANVALGKPPAVIGHPQHDDPAYGWGELRREGDSLFARFEDLHPEFEAGVESGAYRNRSVRVFKDSQHGWIVRHVGWLGAKPPAIPGLKPVEFSQADADAFDFSAMDDCCQLMSWGLGDVATVLRGLRDWVISRDGLETADRVLPDWSINSITSAATRLREQPAAEASAFSSHTPEGAMSFTQADLDRAAQEAAARVRTELTAQFSAQGTELDTLRAERQTERIKAQIDGWKAKGLVLPADEAGMTEFMRALESGTAAEFEFSAADGATPAKKTPSQWFADFMATRKPLVKIGGGQGDGGADVPTLDLTDHRAIAKAASDFQAEEAKAGRTVDIVHAVSIVTARAQAAA